MSNRIPSVFTKARQHMVETQIKNRGVKDPRVLAAMAKVEREKFIPQEFIAESYEDKPVPIGLDQTISQPYIVAYMTEAAQIKSTDRVLEIGTGCGYQTAILAELAKEVYSVERLGAHAENARALLQQLGYKNIFIQEGDGFHGWEEKAPFDAIVVTAAPENVPENLINQLNEGGRLIIPIGGWHQELYRFTKTKHGLVEESLMAVRFVPMVSG